MVTPARSYYGPFIKNELLNCSTNPTTYKRSQDRRVGNLRKKVGLFRAITQTCIAIAIISIQAGSVEAFYIELNPSLSWNLYYEDNIAGDAQNSTGGKLSGFSNLYMPKLEFGLTSSQLSIKGSTQLTVYRYLTENEYDRTDREYNITGAYKLNARSNIGLSAGYSLNSNPERYFTNEQGFQGGVLVRNQQDETKIYMGNYEYNQSPRNSLKLMFAYGTFFSSLDKNTGEIYTYSATFSRLMSIKDTVDFTIGYNNFKYSYGLLGIADTINLGFKLDNYSLSVGLTHQFSDSFKLVFNIGGYIAKTKQRQAVFEENPDTGETIVTGTKTISNSTPGSNFLLQLEKKYFHTTVEFIGKEALGTNPSNGQTYPTIYFTFKIAQDITSKLKGTCTFAYYYSKASAGDYNNRTNIEYNSYYTTLGLQYQYRKNITFSIQYSRAESDNGGANNNSNRVRNTVYLGCTVTFQRPFIVR
jgi:hypothetical protein